MQIETLILLMWNQCPTFTSVMPASDYMESNYFYCLIMSPKSDMYFFDIVRVPIRALPHEFNPSILYWGRITAGCSRYFISYYFKTCNETIELDIAWQHLYNFEVFISQSTKYIIGAEFQFLAN